MRAVIKGFLAVSLTIVSFVAGFTTDTLQNAPQNLQAAQWKLFTVPPETLSQMLAPRPVNAETNDLPPMETYEAVLDLLRTNYYSGDPTADEKRLHATRLTYAAIQGLLSSLNDRYTEFITPQEYKEMLQEQSGSFVGIGARLDVDKENRIVITEPIEGSPAARAGIQSGDKISAVNGKSVLGVPVDDVITKIRGQENTTVRLTVERRGRLLNFVLKRAVVNSPLIDFRMEDPTAKIGYIRLTAFYEQADDQFDHAIEQLEKQGMKALIFDLRDNPGGLLNMAQDIASRFLASGPVVWVKEKNGSMHSLDVEPLSKRGKLSQGNYPVVVLVNSGSASASEIVAGAIQDAKAGKLVGTRTYGKGLVQTIIPLAGDAAVKITTQHYFTRNKNDINARRDSSGNIIAGSGGIVPDVPVEFTEKDLQRQQEAQQADPQNKAILRQYDVQLQKAIETLK